MSKRHATAPQVVGSCTFELLGIPTLPQICYFLRAAACAQPGGPVPSGSRPIIGRARSQTLSLAGEGCLTRASASLLDAHRAPTSLRQYIVCACITRLRASSRDCLDCAAPDTSASEAANDPACACGRSSPRWAAVTAAWHDGLKTAPLRSLPKAHVRSPEDKRRVAQDLREDPLSVCESQHS